MYNFFLLLRCLNVQFNYNLIIIIFFSTRFFDFRNENGLWEEVHCITEALQAGTSNNSQFYRDLFSHLLPGNDLLLCLYYIKVY